MWAILLKYVYSKLIKTVVVIRYFPIGFRCELEHTSSDQEDHCYTTYPPGCSITIYETGND